MEVSEWRLVCGGWCVEVGVWNDGRASAYLLDGSGDDAAVVAHVRALHGEGLAGACLPVGEQADVVAVERALD